MMELGPQSPVALMVVVQRIVESRTPTEVDTVTVAGIAGVLELYIVSILEQKQGTVHDT